MMESGVLSVLFYGSLILYFYMGMYLFSLDTRDRVHRVFFLLCLSLGTWSLSYTLLSHVEMQEMAFVALGFSVWGWGFTYSFLLHLMILLAKAEKRMRFLHWVAVYAPVPITMVLFYGNLFYGQVSRKM